MYLHMVLDTKLYIRVFRIEYVVVFRFLNIDLVLLFLMLELEL